MLECSGHLDQWQKERWNNRKCHVQESQSYVRSRQSCFGLLRLPFCFLFFSSFFQSAKLNGPLFHYLGMVCVWWGWPSWRAGRYSPLQIISDQQRQTRLIFTVPDQAVAAPPSSTVLLRVLANSTPDFSQSLFLLLFFSLSPSLAPFPCELLPPWQRAGKLDGGHGRDVIYIGAFPGERHE